MEQSVRDPPKQETRGSRVVKPSSSAFETRMVCTAFQTRVRRIMLLKECLPVLRGDNEKLLLLSSYVYKTEFTRIPPDKGKI